MQDAAHIGTEEIKSWTNGVGSAVFDRCEDHIPGLQDVPSGNWLPVDTLLAVSSERNVFPSPGSPTTRVSFPWRYGLAKATQLPEARSCCTESGLHSHAKWKKLGNMLLDDSVHRSSNLFVRISR